MPKRLFKKYLPDPDKLREHKSLGFLGTLLADPNLWHINRRSLPGAAFIGIFCGLLPIPFQMPLAALCAIQFRCNLPLSVVLVWISNPITYVPVFFFTYRVGAWLLGMPVAQPEAVTVEWFVEQLVPLWFGSIVCGVFFGILGWGILKLLWRLAVVRHWEARKVARAQSVSEQRVIEDHMEGDDNDKTG